MIIDEKNLNSFKRILFYIFGKENSNKILEEFFTFRQIKKE